MKLWFETHATSLDNEIGIAPGHFDVELSDRGRLQAIELGRRCSERALSAIYTSDLKRSAFTAQIAFSNSPLPIFKDARLRECDYGAWTRCSVEELDSARLQYLDQPFPGGESFREVVRRMQDFLEDLPRHKHDVLIIGHRAPWYALEHLLRHRDLAEVVAALWQWQPGWHYLFEDGQELCATNK